MLVRSRVNRVRRGVSAVETAIVLSGFLTFLFGTFEFGRFVMMRDLVDHAAREGARQASINTSSLTTADIQATVTQCLAGQPFGNVNIQVYLADPSTGNNIGSWNSAQFRQPVIVDVSADFVPMVPAFSLMTGTITLRSKAMMRSEYID
jgi:Flp pilus assembly protein TadG